MTGTIYFIGTHIGNEDDMSKRTIKMLKSAKNIVVENKILFEGLTKNLHIKIDKKNIVEFDTLSGYSPEKEKEINQWALKLLKENQDVYVVADDGMPGIADPGEALARECIKNNINISATPGPSCIVAAAVISGCGHNFSFEAFLPTNKTEWKDFLQQKHKNKAPMIIVLRNEIKGMLLTETEDFLAEIENLWGDTRATLLYNLTTSKEKTIRGYTSVLRKYHMENKALGDTVMMVLDPTNERLAVNTDIA